MALLFPLRFKWPTTFLRVIAMIRDLKHIVDVDYFECGSYCRVFLVSNYVENIGACKSRDLFELSSFIEKIKTLTFVALVSFFNWCVVMQMG